MIATNWNRRGPVRRASWRRIGVSCLALGAALVPAAALAQTAPASQDPEATEIDEVVVTGIRGSLRSAQSIKENADQIVDLSLIHI